MAMTSSPIKNALAYLVATFRSEVDSYQARAYERALKDVAGEVVMAAAEQLINQAAAGRKFYPMPTAPEWKEAAAQVIATKRREAFQIGVAGCEHPQFMESYRDEQGVEWTRRCACYQRGKQLMAAAGEPLALPNYTEPERVE